MPKTFRSSFRALLLPAALAGGLLVFGGQAASAASDAQYQVGGQTIHAVGGDFTAVMSNGSLHVRVNKGNTAIKVGSDSDMITVGAGDEIVLSPTGDGIGMSVSLNVIQGQAVVGTGGSATDDGTVDTILTSSSSLSFGTGVDGADVGPDPMPSADDNGGQVSVGGGDMGD